jgi:hypothetical protein
MVQVPMVTRVTVAFDTVQTGAVWELKLTGSCELAEALRVGEVPRGAFESAANVMVWLA